MSQTKAQLISDLVQALNFTGTSSAPANGVYLSATNTIKLTTNSLPRITISSNGETTFAHAVTVSSATDQLLNLNSSDSNATYLAFQRGGTRISYFGYGGSGSTLNWANEISDGDIHLSVNDGGSTITPLKIDASEGGIVQLLVSGTTRLATSSTGVTITGTCTATTFVGALTGTASGNAVLTGSTNNQIVTVTGANAITGESNLTYDGNELAVYAQTDDTNAVLHLVGKTPNGGVGQAGRTAIIAESTATSNGSSSMHFRTRNSSNSQIIAMTLDSNQNVGIGTETPSVALDIIRSAVTNSDRNTDDALTIENNGTTNINLISASDNSCFLLFSDDERAKAYVKYDHQAGWLEFKADGTQCVRMQADNLNILDGDLVIGTAGHGINFSATANGGVSTPSELLDDYEEGTWDPTLVSSNGDMTTSLSYVQGNYVKVGRLVYISGLLYGTRTGGTGQLRVGALPFTVRSGDHYQVLITDYSLASYGTDFIGIGGYCRNNHTQITLITRQRTSAAATTVSEWSTSSNNYIYFNVTYLTDT